MAPFKTMQVKNVEVIFFAETTRTRIGKRGRVESENNPIISYVSVMWDQDRLLFYFRKLSRTKLYEEQSRKGLTEFNYKYIEVNRAPLLEVLSDFICKWRVVASKS